MGLKENWGTSRLNLKLFGQLRQLFSHQSKTILLEWNFVLFSFLFANCNFLFNKRLLACAYGLKVGNNCCIIPNICSYICFSVSLSCGGTTSENSSYIVQGLTTTAPASPCTYKICPCSTDICR